MVAPPGQQELETGMPIDIRQAKAPEELDDARQLMRDFVAWHRRRHVEDMALIDSYFDQAEFDAELASLPGKYSPPAGSLRIAYRDGQTVGCVALRDLGGTVCEMKRMFVPDAYRGQGIGRVLAERVIADAKAAGFTLMRLDTSRRQSEAMRLYETLGFSRINPYYPVSEALRDWLVFFERKL